MNLEAVYPNENDSEEISIEELRAKSRGWLNRDWAAESKQRIVEKSLKTIVHEPDSALLTETRVNPELVQEVHSQPGTQDNTTTLLDTTIAVDIGRGGKGARPKKMKIKEVRSETQTSMKQHPSCRISRDVLNFYSQNQSRVPHWAKAETEDFGGAYHDFAHKSSH